jgi:hypothetical protein
MFNNPQRAVLELRRLTPEEVRSIAQRSTVVNYIRHNGTIQILSELLQMPLTPNSGLYVYRGERIILITLIAPQRGQETVPRLEDLAFFEIVVHTLE